MLLFERKGESIDDRAQNLEQLCDTVESFRFIHKLKENIVDRSSNERPEVEELPIDAVKSRLKKIPLSRIF